MSVGHLDHDFQVMCSQGLLCLTVKHMAMFVVPDSGAQGEVCCAGQWGTGRSLLCLTLGHRPGQGLLCLTVRYRERFAVPDGGACGELCCV